MRYLWAGAQGSNIPLASNRKGRALHQLRPSQKATKGPQSHFALAIVRDTKSSAKRAVGPLERHAWGACSFSLLVGGKPWSARSVVLGCADRAHLRRRHLEATKFSAQNRARPKDEPDVFTCFWFEFLQCLLISIGSTAQSLVRQGFHFSFRHRACREWVLWQVIRPLSWAWYQWCRISPKVRAVQSSRWS